MLVVAIVLCMGHCDAGYLYVKVMDIEFKHVALKAVGGARSGYQVF